MMALDRTILCQPVMRLTDKATNKEKLAATKPIHLTTRRNPKPQATPNPTWRRFQSIAVDADRRDNSPKPRRQRVKKQIAPKMSCGKKAGPGALGWSAGGKFMVT